MIAGFERDVQRRAAHVATGGVRRTERLDFRMRLAADVVESLAERRRAERDDGPNDRIRRRVSAPAKRELAGAAQIDPVERGEGRDGYGVTSTPFQNAT